MSHADSILWNGRIFNGLVEGFTEALAIRDGRVLATGSRDEIIGLRGRDTRMIDLAGRVAIPGLNDAHMHLLPLGLGMSEVNLRLEDGVGGIDEILHRIAQAAGSRKPGEWVLGRGYDHNELAEKRHPTMEELDRVAPDNPVFIKRTCGHIGVANSLAMRRAGIDIDTPSPEGGMIGRDGNRLTGQLAENAMRPMIDILPKPDHAELSAAIERAGRHMLSQGFTSVMDAGVGMLAGMAEIEAYEDVARNGRLPLRTWACIYGNADGIGDAAHAGGYRFGREVGLLRYGAMKVFGDGSIGGMTAAMSEPYSAGTPGNRGIFIYSDKEMHDFLRHYHRLGYQLAIHAIGDAAIEQVLSGMERADSAAHPIRGRRHRIEHCGFLTDNQLARMTASGIDPVPQPVFIYEFGDLYIDVLGRERAETSYPMRKWLAAGLHPAAGSDAPVCVTDPFRNLFTMVTRRTKRGTLVGAGERLSMAEAVHAYTAIGAYTQFAEEQLGRLVPGQLADIAILSHDIFSVPIEMVEDGIRCDLTLLNGDVAFDRLGQFSGTMR